VKQVLNTWMNGQLVGSWSVERHSHKFVYAPAWLDSAQCRSLSLSLPISATLELKGEVVRNYFDNLLPDNDRIRARLGKRFKVDAGEPFELLQAIGRDCVGAVQLLPEGEAPLGYDRIDAVSLSEDNLVALLEAVPSDVEWLQHEDELFRISIAGAQEKTALLKWQGQWHRPLGATPTTHIIKLPLGLIGGSRRVDAGDSVQNEWLCARIVAALGLPVAHSSIERFGNQTVLAVERFDRQWRDNDSWIARIPQEDFCQSLGLPPDQKYESGGGPGMAKCLQLLQASRDSADRAFFLRTQLAFMLLAATDGHAKNYSIFIRPRDAYEMTPLYDIISMWPYYGNAPNRFRRQKAGPAIVMRSKNVHRHFHTIHARHWRQLAMKHGGQAVWQGMVEMVEAADEALVQVQRQLPDDFPINTWDKISTGMREEAKRFLSELASDLEA
jgi:serine/threonine-protein kinase HipA